VNDTPVGRRQVFETIVARLAAPKPGVIVVSGETGSGRTHLLGHLAAAAEKLGYQVLAGTDADPVAIEPSTTMADVRRRLAGLDDTGTAVDDQMAGGEPASASPQRGIKGAVRRGFDLAFLQWDETREISALFARLAPLMVAIDGFRPNPTFELWFKVVLIPRLRRSHHRVAVIIAGGPGAVQSLEDLADLFVRLGPLDADEVRAQLAQAAVGFSPPLTELELDRYVAAAAAQPAVLSALTSVFGAYRPAVAEEER
jgi:hypothetical protein